MPETRVSRQALRLILGVIGLAIIMLGLNVGFGGIATLGWQGPTDFLQVTDANAFTAQDNHIRFLGGFWLAAGLVFCFGAHDPNKMRIPMMTVCGMVAIGGLTRLSVMDFSLISSTEILPSFLLELLAFPALAAWVGRLRS